MATARPETTSRRFVGRLLVPGDLKTDANAFTTMRWVLASTVMFSHGWDLTQPVAGLDPSVGLFGFPVSRLAVFLFFTLSGFLVTGSLIKRGSVDFTLARGLRLLPGLWVMIAVMVFGLWAVFGTLPLGQYLADPMTHRFVLRNALLWGGEFRLPGIFNDNQFANVVNGSLWTIPHEVRCYIVLALVGAVGLLLTPRLLTGLFVIAAVVHLVVPADIIPVLENPRRLAFSFFLGVLVYLWRDRLWLSWPLALGVSGAALLLPDGVIKTMAIQVTFSYLVLVAAFCSSARFKAASVRLPDYSYGIYIYGFPAQQAVIALGIGLTPFTNIAWGIVIMLPLAALSWHLIEKPALGLKRRAVRPA